MLGLILGGLGTHRTAKSGFSGNLISRSGKGFIAHWCSYANTRIFLQNDMPEVSSEYNSAWLLAVQNSGVRLYGSSE